MKKDVDDIIEEFKRQYNDYVENEYSTQYIKDNLPLLFSAVLISRRKREVSNEIDELLEQQDESQSRIINDERNERNRLQEIERQNLDESSKKIYLKNFIVSGCPEY